jgi:polysaccharide export outer membrane protein
MQAQRIRFSRAIWVARLWPRVGLLAFVLLNGCAPGSDLPPIPPYNGGIYRLGVGDQIRLITYGEDQLSEEFRLGDGGNIAVPLLGSVHAEGLTASELGTELADQLRSKNLFRNPSVSVEVTAYRQISVLGEVAKPGQYAYQPGMTMLTAIASAGGFTYRSVEGYAYVVRQVQNKAVIGKILPQDYVQPGDVIKIYERYF